MAYKGTNLFVAISSTCWVALTEQEGQSGSNGNEQPAMLAKCDGVPPVTTRVFGVGCLMQRTDNGSLYTNTGTFVTPIWTLAGTGALGSTGYTGYTGYTGPGGAASSTGSTGPAGSIGATGATGYTGTIGSTGPAGAAASTGATGPNGLDGATGATGYSGPAGAASSTGATGYTGPTGYTGNNGSASATGATGYTGYTGNAGAASSTGATGYTGNAGAASATGATGYTGYTGYSGPAGSASSTGATGYTGYSGSAGGAGATGPTGPIGPTGYTGIAGSATATGATGYTGYTGAGSAFYGVDGGTNDTYVATITGIAAYTDGLTVNFKANTGNTGPSTLNVNALGAKTIRKRGASNADTTTGDIQAGDIVQVIYNGTYFQLVNPKKVYKTWVSASLTINGGNYTYTHNLGSVPRWCEFIVTSTQNAGRSIQFLADGTLVAGAGNLGDFKSPDGTANFLQVGTNQSNYYDYIISISSTELFIDHSATFGTPGNQNVELCAIFYGYES